MNMGMNMGISANISHLKGKKNHKSMKKAISPFQSLYFKPKEKVTNDEGINSYRATTSVKKQSTFSKLSVEALDTEISCAEKR